MAFKIRRSRTGYSTELKGAGYLNSKMDPAPATPVEASAAAAKAAYEAAAATLTHAVLEVSKAEAAGATVEEVQQLKVREIKVGAGNRHVNPPCVCAYVHVRVESRVSYGSVWVWRPDTDDVLGECPLE